MRYDTDGNTTTHEHANQHKVFSVASWFIMNCGAMEQTMLIVIRDISLPASNHNSGYLLDGYQFI